MFFGGLVVTAFRDDWEPCNFLSFLFELCIEVGNLGFFLSAGFKVFKYGVSLITAILNLFVLKLKVVWLFTF